MTMIDIDIATEVTVRGLPEAVETALIRRNTFTNPEFARKERLGLWIGNTEQTVRLWRRTSAGLVVPVGNVPFLLELLFDAGLDYELADRTNAPPLDVDLVTSGPLFDDQERALVDLLRAPTGLVEAPTGAGKTNMLLSVPSRIKTPTLVLTHTRVLSEQMRERCRTWLGVEPGTLAGDVWDMRPITVAMVQTLARRDLVDVAAYFGAVLVDEVHHAPARTWAAVLNRLPARYKYGFTATAWRKDGLQPLIFRTIGDVTASISSAAVRRAGRIMAPQISTVPTQFRYELADPSGWTRMIGALVQDDARNALIVADVRSRLIDGRRALVLSDRVEHVRALETQLRDLDPVVLTGDAPKAARDAAMTAIRAGARLTIATSSLLGEGVDVPGWDLLFLATPMSGGPRTLQAIGRVTRAAPGKTRATVVDFVDADVPALAGAHRQRAQVYRQAGA
jgi:superfamily II DNA or RNA helicase